MTSFEEIGALLGLVAFAGLAVLVFLTFQQGRHLRRLREWAGRAPERAAALASRDDREREPEEEQLSEEEIAAAVVVEPGPLGRLGGRFRDAWAEIDRRSPVDPRLALGGLVAIVLGVGIATSGFGLLGGDSGGGGANAQRQNKGSKQKSGDDRAPGNSGVKKKAKPPVAVLNGTATLGGAAVEGAADAASAVVVNAGYEVSLTGNVAGTFPTTTVMYTGDDATQAEALADKLVASYPTVTTAPITAEVAAAAGDAELALVVGQDAGSTVGGV